MMQDPIGIPACFSSGEKLTDDAATVTRSGQTVFMSVYRTKIADQCRLITVAWCKNLLLHGLSVSVEGPDGESQYTCKVELKPWYFWRKHGSKRFVAEGKPIDIFWDLKAAKFNGETEPSSEYYVAVVCDEEIVLLLGDLKIDAYMKTGCRPALIDPILVSKKEHIFEMEIRIDGHLVIHVKHLQWKFRGNESIHVNKVRVEVYWDVHDWLFSPGLRHALFIFKPTLSSISTSSSLTSTPLSSQTGSSGSIEGFNATGSSEFCLFFYAWKVG
ncbi:hypothetical protein F0562_024323 [Nyssa sinensis]|uniref:DUF868 domain-containing protein n=1 Tax=Nyssa sinensis TaxID=561372 RepID=A0A5J5BDQ0_9ASTE|nr:hypothetical protein F0562_024323 [Nyssa sinensis]